MFGFEEELMNDRDIVLKVLEKLVNQLGNEHVSEEYCQPIIEEAEEIIKRFK